MKKRVIFTLALTLGLCSGAWGQRATDVLDRGLVAVKTTTGVFCSWRINAEEWYGVQYNIYRDGTKLNSEPLSVSNFSDPSGSTNSKYTVTAIVDGVEQPKSAAASVWANGYLEITPKHPAEAYAGLDASNGGLQHFVPNDATMADVDGDGQLEILMKYDKVASDFVTNDNGVYTIVECLTLDGTVKWWINFGPNMGDFQNNEINIMAYDWDGDGKAEVVFRAADGTQIHQADGSVYTVGDATINYRGGSWPSGQWFMHVGKEYLVYADGLSGKPYDCIDFPLARLEADENPNGLLSGSAYDKLVETYWGDGYGHRSSKYFFGAPYFDGRKPSIFLARGIYTQHKMVALDVDAASHKLAQRWRWNCKDSSSPWYGNGYHNYVVADVDMDGRDEIVYGSMVIDDNGKGLSTTGLGHGDSQHVGDFDPFTPGLEFFGCNEDRPNNNFRDATTSKIYYRTTGGNDDGRANCANFIDEYPGAQGLSSRDDNLIGGASHKAIEGDSKGSVSITQNFRIYWDGDLCDESFDYSNGKNTAGAIYKAKKGQIAVLTGSKTNNDTKGTPCYQGDVFGDWREEVMMRDANNHIRIYTTDYPTEWRNYTLWADHQYRNAMVWQMCGYNQTPHPSYFLGELEGITEAPAPLTMNGRTEVKNGGNIGADAAGKHMIMCETADMTATVAAGAAPKVLTVNAPSWTQGHDDNNNITTEYFTHKLQGGALSGTMLLVKQGEGTLEMAKNTHTYSGDTKVWGGKVVFDGTLQNSHLWLNRHTQLTTNGGTFAKGVRMEYGSAINLGTDAAAGALTTDELSMGIGSVINFDLFNGGAADQINAKTLVIETKNWTNGPEYLQPRFNFTANGELQNGKYELGTVEKLEGDLSDIVIEGFYDRKVTIALEGTKLVATVQNYESGAKTWAGASTNVWNLDSDANFTGADGQTTVFVPGDELTFDDGGNITDITLQGKLMPKSVTFANNNKTYTLSGTGSILGNASLTVSGTGTVNINNSNDFTGGVNLNGGKLVASTFANTIGTDNGALGGVSNPITMRGGAVLSASASATAAQTITVAGGSGTIEVPEGVTLTLSNGVKQSASDQAIVKTGKGTLTMAGGNSVSRLIINEGTVRSTESNLPATVEFGQNGTLDDPCTSYSYTTSNTNFVVPEGMTGKLLLDGRCNYKGKLTGAGNFTVVASDNRNYLQGNWADYAGKITFQTQKRGLYDPSLDWDNGSGLPNAAVTIPSGVSFNAGSRSVQFGNLAGAGVVNTSGSVTVGRRGEDFSFTGSFNNNPSFTKVGAGTWKLSREFTGVKSVAVEGGVLSLNGSKPETMLYKKEIDLSGEGTVLTGRGAVGGLVVNSGVIVRPGLSSSGVYYSSIHVVADVVEQVSGRATFREGSTLELFIRKADGAANSQSAIHVDGTLSLNGKVKISYDHKYNFQDGDAITLWTCGNFSGTPTLELEDLPEGQHWDTTGLLGTTGVVKVVGTASVSAIEADEATDCYVYSVSGLFLGQVYCQPSKAAEALKAEGMAAGVYVVKVGNDAIKVVVE